MTSNRSQTRQSNPLSAAGEQGGARRVHLQRDVHRRDGAGQVDAHGLALQHVVRVDARRPQVARRQAQVQDLRAGGEQRQAQREFCFVC